MIEVENKSLCCGCGACVGACPKKCIKMVEDSEGFLYPVAYKDECINCGLCDKACPIKNSKNRDEEKPRCYASYNKDISIRMDSSSGGLFDLIAKCFLDKEGIVYGAAFNKNNSVEHIRVDNEKDLFKLRKSKYVQSEISSRIYEQVKLDLDNGRLVLFSGTPCQVEGLLMFLKKDYGNLYTQDIICHGVPSKKVWQKYLKEHQVNERVNINFRDKKDGWENYCVNIEGVSCIASRNDNYMKSFLSECNIRPSCYKCMFKKVHRNSDITLGDFWGIREMCPDMYDEYGVSAILIHSKKGEDLFSNIKENIVFKEVGYEKVVAYNKAYYSSVKENKNRKKFFKNLDKYEMDVLCKKYCKKSLKIRIVDKTKHIIKKVLFINKK